MLEQALVEAPDDRATHAAYADWLTEQGDPGELTAVHLALEDKAVPAGAAPGPAGAGTAGGTRPRLAGGAGPGPARRPGALLQQGPQGRAVAVPPGLAVLLGDLWLASRRRERSPVAPGSAAWRN